MANELLDIQKYFGPRIVIVQTNDANEATALLVPIDGFFHPVTWDSEKEAFLIREPVQCRADPEYIYKDKAALIKWIEEAHGVLGPSATPEERAVAFRAWYKREYERTHRYLLFPEETEVLATQEKVWNGAPFFKISHDAWLDDARIQTGIRISQSYGKRTVTHLNREWLLDVLLKNDDWSDEAVYRYSWEM